MKIQDIVIDGPLYISLSDKEPDEENDLGGGLTYFYNDNVLVGIGVENTITITGYLREVSE